MAIDEKILNKRLNKQGKVETFKDDGRIGLFCIISESGIIRFQMRYLFLEKKVKMKLGYYPSFSINDARLKCLEYRNILDTGRDPRQEIHAKRVENEQALTVRDALNKWLNAKSYRSDHDAYKKAFSTYIYTKIGDRILNDTTFTDWDLVFNNPNLKKYPVRASQLLSTLRSAMNYLSLKQWAQCFILQSYTSDDVGKRAKKGERRLLEHELKLLWQFVNDKTDIQHKFHRRSLLVVKLILAFGDRTIELRTAKKTDFDLVNLLWHCRNSKNESTIIRPIHPNLADTIKEIIALYPNTDILLPPTTNPTSDKPVTASALSNLATGFNKHLNIEKWNLHDLRRTIKSYMTDEEIDDGISEKILGHKITGVKAHYELSPMIKQQMKAYNVWMEHLNSLL